MTDCRPMDMTLQAFVELAPAAKLPYIGDCSVLYARQFQRRDLDHLCTVADACRWLHKRASGASFLMGLLPHRLALNFFVQPSSRTFLSFNAAQAILGMRRMSLRDVKISSISKGESLLDSIRTFLSYVDLIVMRHSDDNAAEAAFWISVQAHRRLHFTGKPDRPVPIVSGGSGTREHPTQALLDIYTLEKSLEKQGGIDGKTIMLVGDLKRGRTVRSLCFLMPGYRDVQLVFAAPERYQMEADVLAFLDEHAIRYRFADSIDADVANVDAVYMTRIQDEWDNLAPGTHAQAGNDFIFRQAHLERMKPHACLMHPLPKREEIEEAIDYLDDPRIVYWRQERNGMWMRVALIARLFQVDDAILAEYRREKCGPIAAAEPVTPVPA